MKICGLGSILEVLIKKIRKLWASTSSISIQHTWWLMERQTQSAFCQTSRLLPNALKCYLRNVLLLPQPFYNQRHLKCLKRCTSGAHSTMDKEWQGHVWNFLSASFSGTPHHLYQHFHGNTATENACRPILDLQPGGLRQPNMRQARTWKTFRCLCCPSLISKTLGNAKWTFWQGTNSAKVLLIPIAFYIPCWKMVVASVFCEQVWKLGLYE